MCAYAMSKTAANVAREVRSTPVCVHLLHNAACVMVIITANVILQALLRIAELDCTTLFEWEKMRSLLRDTLKAQLGGDRLSRERNCACVEVLRSVALGSVDDGACMCDGPHECICSVGDGPVFGETLNRCLARVHKCMCHEYVVPDAQMTSEYGTAGFIQGNVVCKAFHHACICRRFDASICRSVEDGHYCSCARTTAACRLGDKSPHECRCAEPFAEDLIRCRRHHHPTSGAMRPPAAWWRAPLNRNIIL